MKDYEKVYKEIIDYGYDAELHHRDYAAFLELETFCVVVKMLKEGQSRDEVIKDMESYLEILTKEMKSTLIGYKIMRRNSDIASSNLN